MQWFLQTTLSNTLLAAILALAALAVSKTFRRPALSHAARRRARRSRTTRSQ